MRAPLLVLALTATAFAGCVSAPSELEGAVVDPVITPPGDPIVRFDANGTLLPVDVPGAGSPWYALTGHRGAEPNVGVTKSGAIFSTAGDLVIRSVDRGATWETVYAFGLERFGAPVDPIRNSDPMLWVDPVTDRVYADPMFPTLECTTLAWSEDDGATWIERHAHCHPPVMDHQKFATGVPGPDANPLAGVLHPTVLYRCWNALVGTHCSASYDGGLSFPTTSLVLNRFRDGCGGLNGMPSAGPDGTVVVGASLGCDGPVLGLSRDSGLTWSVVEGPKDHGGELNDPEIEWGPDGTMYVLWTGDDFIPYLARTKDLGQTWEGPWRVAAPEVTSTVFAAMVAGDEGKLAIAYVGTKDTSSDPSDAPAETRWHLYVVTTEGATDPSPTFTSVRVTPHEDPVQIGCVWMRGLSAAGTECRNLLDFIDAAVHPDGTFVVAYTEGCTEGCAFVPDAKDDDSRSRDIALARLDGWILKTPAEVEPPTA